MANAAQHQSDDEFTLELIRIQQRLRGFLRCLLVEADKLDDVQQETNRVLLRKSASYRPGTDFWAWACQVARFEVMAHHRNRQRDRNLFFDAELIDDLAERAEARLTDSTEREEALRECLQQLSEKNTRLIKSRYAQGQSVDGIASSTGRPAGSIRQTLYRIRQQLRECIELRLEEAHS